MEYKGGVIAGFDISRTIGWCVGLPDNIPVCGSYEVPGKSSGALGLNAGRWYRKFIEQHNPEVIVYEQPLAPQYLVRKDKETGKLVFNTTRHTLEILYSLPFLLESVAAHYRVPIFDVPAADWREHYLGKITFPKNLPAKEKRLRWKRYALNKGIELGWGPQDDNAGDACGVWSYARGVCVPGLAMAPTALFGRAI